MRAPLLGLLVVVAIVGVAAFVLVGAAQPAYGCTTIDSPAVPLSGQLGQVQADQGRSHVSLGEKISYSICPPASGKHVNRANYGPLQPKVYGPEDANQPQGWIHNLEHGGLVLLYSCDLGACDDASLAALRSFSSGFPSTPICGLAPGIVGPVVARFEEMPTRFAALIWGRALYQDVLDPQQVYDFYTRYGERVDENGGWIAPPEPQCAAPTPTPSAGPSASPTGSPPAEPSPSAS